MNKIPRLTFWRVIAAAILIAGFYSLIVRFVQGLGAATNLSDQFPWGLWIGFDVLVGVGLAAGGFTIAAIVHIFNIEKYEPISRPSLLTAFLGYILVGAAIMLDIGQSHRIWHPIVHWNPHSVMFEVSWCVMLYLTVLALEFSPLVLEKFNLHVPLKLIRKIYLPLVIAGVILSTLHQSSLGTVYVIVPNKLHPLWYTPMLPVFFFITAIFTGLAMTIVESFLSYRAFGKRLELDILSGLARVMVLVMGVYFVLKFQNLMVRDSLHYVFELTQESVLFWGEIGLGVVIPIILLLSPKIRHNRTGLFFSSLLVVLGFILNRLNVAITGIVHSDTYFPSWMEIAITLSMVTVAFIAFALAVRYLDVFPKEELDDQEGGLEVGMSWKFLAGMWLVVLLGLVTYGMATSRENNEAQKPPSKIERAVSPMEDQDLDQLPEDMVFDQNEDSPAQVIFSHETHMMMQDNVSCEPCHPRLYTYKFDPLRNVKMSGEVMHTDRSCGYCHNGEDAFGIDDDCEMCHYE